ncbi:hypothetical protein WJX72_003306 [[Myrmecia] bisecta]|uniref:Cytosol aminopeptidase domain-containing protein n=1 Tax=[Myrmecia] bisecta TaxID=41462 RepID=A0AAW1PS06_9CHLO
MAAIAGRCTPSCTRFAAACSRGCRLSRQAGQLFSSRLVSSSFRGQPVPQCRVISEWPLRWQTRSRSFATKAMAATNQVAFYPEKYPSVVPAGGDAASWQGDLLAIGVFEDALATTDNKTSIKSEELRQLDQQYGGLISELIEHAEFKGKPGSSSFARAGGKARFLGIVGLGPAAKAAPTSKWGPTPFQSFGSALATAAKTHKAKTAAAHIVCGDALSAETKVAAVGKIALGAVLGAYEATRFKEKGKPSPLEAVEVLNLGSDASAAAAAEQGLGFAKGTLLTRYLVEAPPNICTPAHLAEAAQSIADSAPDVFKLQILEREDCEKLNMGCYLGVAECAHNPPKFIHLTYTPKGGNVKRRVGLVGKGLTFDSGGYNLKVGGMIEMMKFDMGGAGAVLGAAKILSHIQPEGVEVHFISAACENMIDGKGMRPGDILTASNGKTVEVNNTDAEGRLTLADALLYAQNQAKVERVIDIATLTGACMVALGQGIAGVFTPNDDIAGAIQDASVTTGEKLWRMPFEDSYWECMKSPIADMKNAGNRYAGAITAALFLEKFVDTDKVQWAHIDIAGPAWDDKLGGATGFGAQTLAQWAISQGQA